MSVDQGLTGVLPNAEQLLRLFVNNVQDYALLMLDPDGNVVSWNAGAQSIKGYAADEVIGRHFSCFYLPEDIAAGKPQRELETAAREGRFEDSGFRVRKDGARFWANVVITAVFDTDGRLRGFGKIARDITTQVEAEAKLKSSEAKLKGLVDTLLDTIVDGLVTIDKQGVIQSFNKASTRLFGYAPEEVLGRNFGLLLAAPERASSDLAAILPALDASASSPGTTSRVIPGRRKNGSTFPMELAFGHAADDTIDGHDFVGIVRDLTERQEADGIREQLRQAQKMEALGQLTGGIAHDFNNLLAVILGNLDLLQEAIKGDATLQQHLTPCLRAALRGSELTQRLLAFGRKQALQPKVISVNELISHFSPLLHRTLGERVSVITAFASDLWPVKIDPGQLEDALLNLAVNARDAMPEGGKITLETKNVQLDADYAAHNPDITPGDYVLVAVSDNGTGMTPEVAAKAFEPFFTTKDSGRGSGLGLSMVYGFVKQSAGHIKIYSELGEGTSVKLYLPRAVDALSAATEQEAASPALAATPKLVLVVEDDEAVLKLTATMVESLGYRVVTAKSSDEALRLLESRDDIDILLTDVMLPGSFNGPALAKRALELRPEVKILFTSGYAEQAIMENNLLEQGVNLLGKPFRKHQLAEKLMALQSR